MIRANPDQLHLSNAVNERNARLSKRAEAAADIGLVICAFVCIVILLATL